MGMLTNKEFEIKVKEMGFEQCWYEDILGSPIEFEDNIFDTWYRLEKRPRYSFKLLSANTIEAEENHNMVDIGYIHFPKTLGVNEEYKDHTWDKYPTIFSLATKIEGLRNKGIYSRIEITDWNEMSNEAWDVWYLDIPNGDIGLEVLEQSDEMLFKYHVICIIESNKKSTRVYTEPETIKHMLSINDKAPEISYKIKFKMKEGLKISKDIQKEVQDILNKLNINSDNGAEVKINDNEVMIDYAGLNLDIEGWASHYTDVYSDEDFKKAKEGNCFDEYYNYAIKNISVEVKSVHPFKDIELGFDREEMLKLLVLVYLKKDSIKRV